MVDGDNANNEAVETFRVGYTVYTKIGIAAVILFVGQTVFKTLYESVHNKRLTIDVVDIWFLVVLCVLAFFAWLIRRNALVVLDDRGLMHQSWRKRKTSIAWEAVTALIQTDNTGIFILGIEFTDDFDRQRSLALAEDTPRRGKTSKLIEELKESILRHKHFTESSETRSFVYGKQIIWE
jgi:hypothetical protein